MELNELLKKISAMQTAAASRLSKDSSESLRLYVQGMSDGLDGVMQTIRKAIEAERTRQRLAKLESELAQEVTPEWPELPGDTVKAESPPRPVGVPGSMASEPRSYP